MTKKPTSSVRKQIEHEKELNELHSIRASRSRGTSIHIGTCTGGLIEFSIRCHDQYLWYLMQPVEAIEFMEQIAAACGVEILKRPKEDFTAWRSWDPDQPERSDWKGSAPFQLSGSERKALKKYQENKFKVVPVQTNVEEKPKLEASSRRKKKTQEPEETEE